MAALLLAGWLALACSGSADTRYVNLNNPAPAAPYTSWATAATNIQDAVNIAVAGDLILVTNGVYQTGARAVYGMSNRVAVTKAVTVQSVNGPAVTTIAGFRVPDTTNGAAAVRCVYLTNGAVLSGFTLTNGATQTSGNSYTNQSGGGVWCESVSAVVNNCTLSGNSASSYGGGASSGTLNNCIVYYNDRWSGPNYDNSTFNYSCTTPLPTSGTGNITNAPLFVSTNAWANLRLQSNSPCINAGNNAYVTGAYDLDGNPRIVGGTVDVGAYEFQSPASQLSYAWLQQYGLPTDGSADFTDADGDGANNWQEWVAGTIPTDALSMLWLGLPVVTPGSVTLTWTSVPNRFYTLEQATNLGGVPAFSVLRSNLAGPPGTTSWTDTNAPATGPRFYRVGVGN